MHKIFHHQIKVYYEDTDAGGIVFYANYLKFLERARTEALSLLGFSNVKIKINYKALIIVKSCNIEFKKPSVLEDILKIESYVLSFTKTSFFMSQIIKKNNDIIVKAKIHLVCINMKNKPIRIPDSIIMSLKPYLCDSGKKI